MFFGMKDYNSFDVELKFYMQNDVLYRVSQKKRNGGFSVPCELKVLYLFTSVGQTSSAEVNNTKIIKFAWVVLILWPFL